MRERGGKGSKRGRLRNDFTRKIKRSLYRYISKKDRQCKKYEISVRLFGLMENQPLIVI